MQDKTEQWTHTASSPNAEESGVEAIASRQSQDFFFHTMKQTGRQGLAMRRQSFKGRTVVLDCAWGLNSSGVHTCCVATGFGVKIDPEVGKYICTRMQKGMHQFRAAENFLMLESMQECRYALLQAKARDSNC